MKKLSIIWLIQIAFLSFWAPHFASADQETALTIFESGEVIALQEILKDVQNRYNAELLEVELEFKDPVWIYKIQIIVDDTQLLKLIYDAASGKLNDVIGHDPSMFGEFLTEENN